MTIYNSVRTYVSNRARYARTVREIRDLPADIAQDLGINTRDARSIARNAVYGA